MTSGSSTHGASAIGQTSTDTTPIRVVIRGVSTNASAATSWVVSEPISSLRTSRSIPKNATHSRSAHHSRWIIQGGMSRRWPKAKNGPIGHA